jgi:excisionase family DNA binding protein
MELNQQTIADYLHAIELRQKNIEALLLSQKTVLNLDDVSEYTGLSKSYLYKLTCTRGIPCYKPNGKQVYFDRAEIDKWLLKNRKSTSEEIEQDAVNYSFKKKGNKA